MKLDDFFKFLAKFPVDDYVVRLKLKYDDEKDYRYTNEILEFDGDDYVWSNDWDEGQQDVEVIGYMPVSDIDTFCIPIDKKQFVCGNCRRLIFKDYKHHQGICRLTRLPRDFESHCDHEEEMS